MKFEGMHQPLENILSGLPSWALHENGSSSQKENEVGPELPSIQKKRAAVLIVVYIAEQGPGTGGLIASRNGNCLVESHLYLAEVSKGNAAGFIEALLEARCFYVAPGCRLALGIHECPR